MTVIVVIDERDIVDRGVFMIIEEINSILFLMLLPLPLPMIMMMMRMIDIAQFSRKQWLTIPPHCMPCNHNRNNADENNNEFQRLPFDFLVCQYS